jgi:hypothetical protein
MFSITSFASSESLCLLGMATTGVTRPLTIYYHKFGYATPSKYYFKGPNQKLDLSKYGYEGG